MKISDIINKSFNNIIKSKTNKNIIIIIILNTIVSLLSLITYKGFQDFIEANYYKNINFRTITITKKDGLNIDKKDIEKIEKVNHITDIISMKYNSYTIYTNLKNDNYDGVITIKPLLKNIKQHIECVELKENELMCPINFYPDSLVGNIDFSLKKNNIYKKELKNLQLDFKYVNINESGKYIHKNLKIVNLYDNTKTLDSLNTCYMEYTSFQKIIDEARGNLNYGYNVYVDSVQNINLVINELNKNYNAYVSAEFNDSIIKFFSITCLLITLISNISSILVLVLYLKKRLINKEHNIGILRSIGYTQKDIKRYYLLENLLTLLIIFIISFIIFIIVYILLSNTIIETISLYNIIIKVDIKSIILTFINIVIIPSIILYYIIKELSNSPIIKLLNKGE